MKERTKYPTVSEVIIITDEIMKRLGCPCERVSDYGCDGCPLFQQVLAEKRGLTTNNVT